MRPIIVVASLLRAAAKVRCGGCLAGRNLTLAFDASYSGLSNQRVNIVHGVAVACAVGAAGVVNPALRFGINHERAPAHVVARSTKKTIYKNIVDYAKARNSIKETGLGRLYNVRRFKEAVAALGLRTVPRAAAAGQRTIRLDLRHEIHGLPAHALCARMEALLGGARDAVVHVGEGFGLLAMWAPGAERKNEPLLAAVDDMLEFNDAVQRAASRCRAQLPAVYNGLHYRGEAEAAVTWANLSGVPADASGIRIAWRLRALGFEPSVPLLVASGLEAPLVVPGFDVVTAAQLLGPQRVQKLESHLEDVGLGPVNHVLLEQARKFAGFSHSTFTGHVSFRRARGEAEPCAATYTYDGGPVTTFPWTGSRPLCARRLRVAFFAGLESSGHAFWTSLLARMPLAFAADDGATKHLYALDKRTGVFSAADEGAREASAAAFVAALKAAAARGERRVVALNGMSQGEGRGNWGTMSYPNHAGPFKALQKPDLRVLAELCEEAGADLRVVVVTRPVEDVLPSVVRRGFYPGLMEAVKVLELQVFALASELKLLDRDLISCWRYGSEDVPRVAAHLRLAPRAASKLSRLARELWRPRFACADREGPFPPPGREGARPRSCRWYAKQGWCPRLKDECAASCGSCGGAEADVARKWAERVRTSPVARTLRIAAAELLEPFCEG